jgi:hypothetical protein
MANLYNLSAGVVQDIQIQGENVNDIWKNQLNILCIHQHDFVSNIKSPSRSITRNMGQDGDGHAHFDQIWQPNITMNYMGVDQNIKF